MKNQKDLWWDLCEKERHKGREKERESVYLSILE